MNVERVSVVTVCLNARDSIRLTLESVRRQSFPTVDHIIIDGGSIDGTLEIVHEYNVAYLSSGKDRGVYDAMDKGRIAATGDIAIFLNAGDVFFDEHVCREVAAFMERHNPDIIFGNLMPVYLRASDTHDHGAFKAGRMVENEFRAIRDLPQIYDTSIHHQSTFYKTSLLRRVAYTCPAPEGTGEYNLLLQAIFDRGAKVKYFDRPISRFALGGISTRDFEAEYARYVKGVTALRDIYFPNGRPSGGKNFFIVEPHPKEAALSAEEDAPVAKTMSVADMPASPGPAELPGQPPARASLLRSSLAKLLSGGSSTIEQRLASVEGKLVTLQQSIEAMEAGLHRGLNPMAHDLSVVLNENRQYGLSALELLRTAIARPDGSAHIIRNIETIMVENRHYGLSTIDALRALISRLDASGLEPIARDLSTILAENRHYGLSALDALRSIMSRMAVAGMEPAAHGIADLQSKMDTLSESLKRFDYDLGRSKVLTSEVIRRLAPPTHPAAAGFQVFSQFDEDGILDWLTSRIVDCPRRFIEVGCGNYRESNTRFLAEARNWRGLIIDGSPDNIAAAMALPEHWRYGLTARAAIVTSENIDSLLCDYAKGQDIGVLTIDVDGMDYWLWDAVHNISPWVVVVEFNAAFGPDAAITVPYDPGFLRMKAHYTGVYAGASLGALRHLGQKKGYRLVATNSGSNNAFFVRDDLIERYNVPTDPGPFRFPSFREARKEDGTLMLAFVEDALTLIQSMDVVDVTTGRTTTVGKATAPISTLDAADEAKATPTRPRPRAGKPRKGS